MARFTRIFGGRSLARVSRLVPRDPAVDRRCRFFGVLVVVALGLGFVSGANAQTDRLAVDKSAPVVEATSAATAALVTPLDEQLQHLVTNSTAERQHLAARILELSNGLAQIDGSPADKIEAGYVIAASLYYMASDFSAANGALVRAAEFASSRGEVFQAANRYLDVVALTARQRVRTPQDVQEARDYYARARGLASSSLLTSAQRAALLARAE